MPYEIEDAKRAYPTIGTLTDNGVVHVTQGLSPVSSKIDVLDYCSTFDPIGRSGYVPIDVYLMPEERFSRALKCMTEVFKARLCVSELVTIEREGERLGDVVVSDGAIGLATVSGLYIGGALLKSGIPLEWKFSGLLQIQNRCAFSFVELIEYQSCSIPPSELFITGRMTSMAKASRSGEGKIWASFADFHVPCRTQFEALVADLESPAQHRC